VRIPTIGDSPSETAILATIWESIPPEVSSVAIAFEGASFLAQSAVAFLGGMTRSLQARGVCVTFDWDTLASDVARNLGRNGFLASIGGLPGRERGNAIPFREDTKSNPPAVIEYLRGDWLGRGWVQVSPRLGDVISGRVFELYANAFEHSESAVGVFSCGQHYPRIRKLSLSVMDFGNGVPRNVRAFLHRPSMGAPDAILWAFQRGHTTRPQGMGRGIGLDIMREFIRVNSGRMDLYSEYGHVSIVGGETRFSRMRAPVPGTLVNITLRCDERYYILASEAAHGPLF
jgi:hypothetical protein